MIEAIFLFGADVILIRIDEHHIQFGNTSYGTRLGTIDGLQLSRSGVEKEFPDLVNNVLWREEAIRRFKENIKSLKGEKAILRYIEEDLGKHGYVLKRWKQNGYREVKV